MMSSIRILNQDYRGTFEYMVKLKENSSEIIVLIAPHHTAERGNSKYHNALRSKMIGD